MNKKWKSGTCLKKRGRKDNPIDQTISQITNNMSS